MHALRPSPLEKGWDEAESVGNFFGLKDGIRFERNTKSLPTEMTLVLRDSNSLDKQPIIFHYKFKTYQFQSANSIIAMILGNAVSRMIGNLIFNCIPNYLIVVRNLNG